MGVALRDRDARDPTILNMFLNLLATARLFSTSAIASFPKLKSHSGAKKRWRAIASGKFKRVRVSCPTTTRSTDRFFAMPGSCQPFAQECIKEPRTEEQPRSNNVLESIADSHPEKIAPICLNSYIGQSFHYSMPLKCLHLRIRLSVVLHVASSVD
jgi:hypothetical protein